MAGLASPFLNTTGMAWQLRKEGYPSFGEGSRRHTYLKSVLYATPEAASATTITLLDPPTARLDYPDWPIEEKIDRQEPLAGATMKLTVPSCGHGTVGWRGGLLVNGPTCLTYRVSGKRTVTRRVPIGRDAFCD